MGEIKESSAVLLLRAALAAAEMGLDVNFDIVITHKDGGTMKYNFGRPDQKIADGKATLDLTKIAGGHYR